MKPGKRDYKHNVLITGAHLEELQRHTWCMAESFGLDRRIENYRGKRPIGLYRWDLECLLDVIETVREQPSEYPSRDAEEYRTLQELYEYLKAEYEHHFGRW